MTDTPTTEDLEARIGELSAQLYADTTAQIAELRRQYGLVSPLAIPTSGLIPNVVDGQLIESAWGNAIRDRAIQRFTNKAALDAGWPSPVPGDYAETTDTHHLWGHDGTRWYVHSARRKGWNTFNSTEIFLGATITPLAAFTITLPAVAPPGYYHLAFIGQFWTSIQIILQFRKNGVAGSQATVQASSAGTNDYTTQATQTVFASVVPGDVLEVAASGNGAGMRAGSNFVATWIGDY